MGGTGVACADDYVAQYYNPGLLGFFGDGVAPGQRFESDNNDLERKDWGMGVDLTGGARAVGNLATYVNDILKIDVNKLKKLGQSGNKDTSALTDAVKVLNALSQFDPDKDAVLMDFNGGAGLRIMNVVLGARVYGNAVGKIEGAVDTTHLGIELPGGTDVASLIGDIPAAPSGYTIQHLSTTQQSFLTTQLTAAGGAPADVANAIANLDYAIGKAGIPDSAIQSVVTQVDNLIQASGLSGSSSLFGENTTTIRMVGLSVGEVPVSYGHSIGEHFSIGGSVKFMVGRVYGLQVRVLDSSTKSFGNYVTDAKDTYSQSTNFGVDLGVAARCKYLQVGLTGRNLNGPKFTGPTISGVKFPDYKLDPQVTAGAAFIPFTTLTFAGDIDLTKSETALETMETQYAGAGVEWDIVRFLALRAGLRKDIANQDSHLMYTAGLGVNLYAVRLDLAGQISKDTVTYDGKEYPQEARGSFALATDW
jgi:hypothetical protein